jgi:hypothetical protein
MDDGPPIRYIVATAVAGALVVGGVWLPWIRKIPGPNGAVTMEWVPGLDAGIGNAGYDWLIVSLVVITVGITLLTRYSRRRPDALLIAVGGFVVLLSGRLFASYAGGYVIEPGLGVLFAGGLLFLMLGVSGFLTYYSVDLRLEREESDRRPE